MKHNIAIRALNESMKSDKLNHIEIVLTFQRTDRIMNQMRILVVAISASAAILAAACNRTCPIGDGGNNNAAVTQGSADDFANNVPQTVYFNFDDSTLTESAKKRVEAQACWLRTYSGTRISVAGHTDVRGTGEYNMALGEARANSVSRALQSSGVDGTRISTVSYGKERVVDTGTDEMAHAKNRRTVTTVEP
ncbi:MAG: OmpA family protein [Holosporales bacterium]|jgi:peptidoglycan-associated lipoprotein|nr:OmpA family protein [Holosporales bacterium]